MKGHGRSLSSVKNEHKSPKRRVLTTKAKLMQETKEKLRQKYACVLLNPFLKALVSILSCGAGGVLYWAQVQAESESEPANGSVSEVRAGAPASVSHERFFRTQATVRETSGKRAQRATERAQRV